MGIKILGATTGSINLDVPSSVTGNIDLTLPANTGSADQLLVTDGSGNLSFKTVNGATKNMVINGDMQVHQRDSAPYTGNYVYTLDRWELEKNTASSTVEITQDTDAPSGFKNSLKVETTSLGSPPSYEYGWIQTKLEGNTTLPLDWCTGGTPKPATLSFYVKASIAGTYTLKIGDNYGDYSYIAEYTVNTANTWERKVITFPTTFPGSTTYFTKDNTTSIKIQWNLGHGQMWQVTTLNQWITSSMASTSSTSVQLSYNLNATLRLTGVQFEVGDSASEYQHESYAENLARCQRYFCCLKSSLCNPLYGIAYRIIAPAPVVEMRANPSMAYYNPSNGTSNQTAEHSSGTARSINSVNSANYTAGSSTYFGMSSNAVYAQNVNVNFDAEL
jgi:hypothetical protein